jgi:hypothetical protein
MLPEYHMALERLKAAGWHVNGGGFDRELPANIQTRFAWLPKEINEFVRELEMAVSADAKIWLLGILDFYGTSQSAYKWDEWQQMSLDAADGDLRLIKSIQAFWNNHFPTAHSVKGGYAYFAVRRTDFAVVCGEETEFEEASIIAPSFLEFLDLLAKNDPKLARWM